MPDAALRSTIGAMLEVLRLRTVSNVTYSGTEAVPSSGSDLSGRRALVTGAASGIGAAVATRLAAAGAQVVLLDRDAGASAVAERIGGTSHVVDLSDLDGIDALDADLLDADIVVNNAGFQHVAPIPEFPPETFSRLLRIMLEAPFRIARRVLPGMYARGFGRVVNISSVHGMRASAYKAGYVSAKHGLEGLSKVIALEGAPHGVTSVCVNPGYVRTPLVEQQIEAQSKAHGIPPERVIDEDLLERTPLKRLVEPEEVAETVAWLCGPHARSVTGTSIALDGGWTAH
jgi:3-hydroxybutyrate dehydrogenase